LESENETDEDFLPRKTHAVKRKSRSRAAPKAKRRKHDRTDPAYTSGQGVLRNLLQPANVQDLSHRGGIDKFQVGDSKVSYKRRDYAMMGLWKDAPKDRQQEYRDQAKMLNDYMYYIPKLRARMDKQTKLWIVDGLLCQIYHHQIHGMIQPRSFSAFELIIFAGMGWIRRREAESEAAKANAATSRNSSLPIAMAVCGGILADSMGLGKTIQIIGAMLDGKRPKRNGPNLVLVPKGLLDNWLQELKKQVGEELFRQVLVWKHLALMLNLKMPPSSQFDKKDISKAWIVIATFPEISKENCLLRSLKWHRLVIDEAHGLRNPNTRLFQSVYSIDAEFRWLLSATLLINGPEEIYSYLKLLRLSGTESRKKFNKEYGFGKNRGKPKTGESSSRLDEILSYLVLRRTETTKYFGVKTVNIPDSTDYKIPVSDLPARHSSSYLKQLKLDPITEILHAFVRDRGIQAYGRLLNENKGENIMDAVLQTSGSSKEADEESQSGSNTENGERGQKTKSRAAVIRSIQVMRQLENHFFIPEQFFRDHADDDLLQSIQRALANGTGVGNNIPLIYKLRDKLAREHRRRNGELLESPAEPGASLKDDKYGLHGWLQRSYAKYANSIQVWETTFLT
jgi:SNF2 family DNA or RNA helicase